MKKPVRLVIYLGLIGLAWFILSPALTINTAQIGAPVREAMEGVNGYLLTLMVFALALLITLVISSGWGLVILGAAALGGLIVVSIIHPFMFPLLTPLFALWVFCATARRDAKPKAEAEA